MIESFSVLWQSLIYNGSNAVLDKEHISAREWIYDIQASTYHLKEPLSPSNFLEFSTDRLVCTKGHKRKGSNLCFLQTLQGINTGKLNEIDMTRGQLAIDASCSVAFFSDVQGQFFLERVRPCPAIMDLPWPWPFSFSTSSWCMEMGPYLRQARLRQAQLRQAQICKWFKLKARTSQVSSCGRSRLRKAAVCSSRRLRTSGVCTQDPLLSPTTSSVSVQGNTSHTQRAGP